MESTNQRDGSFGLWLLDHSLSQLIAITLIHKQSHKKASKPKEPSLWLPLVCGGWIFGDFFREIDKKVITLPYWKLLHRVSVPQGAELKGNQVRILNSTRCCKSHTKSEASAYTLPLVVSLLQRLHHIIREGVSTMGTSQKTCPHCKPTAAERHHCPFSAQSKVHVAFEP